MNFLKWLLALFALAIAAGLVSALLYPLLGPLGTMLPTFWSGYAWRILDLKYRNSEEAKK